VSAIPSYRQYLLLGPGSGWRIHEADGLTEDKVTGAYSLDALPGAALVWPPIQGAAPLSPAAVASGKDSLIYVLDAADMRVKVVDPAGKLPAHKLLGVGGFGKDARHFKGAEDIALWHDGAVVVADTGNSEVKIFSPDPYSLVAVWDAFSRPTRIACVASGLLWVLDQGSNRVVGIDREGTARVELPGLTAPRALAVDSVGEVAVLDDTSLLLFSASGGMPTIIETVPGGTCVTFDDKGNIYAGTQGGLIYSFVPDGLGGWQKGIGVVGQQAAVSALLSLGGSTLLAIGQVPSAKSAQFWQIDSAAGHVPEGKLTTEDLNSGITGCVWHRIALDADIPAGTSIDVHTECYDTASGHGAPDLIPPPTKLSGEVLDCLVQSGKTDRGASGQYLRLRLVFRGDGVATPVLRGIRIWFPRDSWLQYLPAIYQEDDESRSFLARFLAILQTAFEKFDERIDNIWTYFDPSSVPDKWYFWLAAWIALPIEPSWTSAQRRAVLKKAGQQYRLRGTMAGLQQLILDYAGVSARVFEHFHLRQLIFLHDDPAKALPAGGGRLWSRDYYRRLQLGVYSRVGYFNLVGEPEPGVEAISWGAHEFTVFFDAEPLSTDATQKKVAAVVEREKPAHTKVNYRPVYSRLRIGIQATVGLDTRIGVAGEAVLGLVSTLSYDAILAASRLERGIRAFGASVRPRLGINSRLC
jgi:phage tail-like protein